MITAEIVRKHDHPVYYCASCRDTFSPGEMTDMTVRGYRAAVVRSTQDGDRITYHLTLACAARMFRTHRGRAIIVTAMGTLRSRGVTCRQADKAVLLALGGGDAK
jgi:hypothetical protein